MEALNGSAQSDAEIVRQRIESMLTDYQRVHGLIILFRQDLVICHPTTTSQTNFPLCSQVKIDQVVMSNDYDLIHARK